MLEQKSEEALIREKVEALVNMINDKLEAWSHDDAAELVIRLGNEAEVPEKVQRRVLEFYDEAGWGSSVTILLVQPESAELLTQDPSAEVVHAVRIKFSHP